MLSSELDCEQIYSKCSRCLSQVVNEIYPVWTYSYLALLFPVFLATDYLCYKPVLILQGTSLVVTYVVMLKTKDLIAMQLMEFFFGLATASEVAYFSYIYSIVEPAQYQRVTSYCRSITLFGSAAGSLAGQLLLSVAKVQLFHLVIFTLSSAVVAFVAPWFLPMPRRSLFFHKIPNAADSEAQSNSAALLQNGGDLESRVPLNSPDTAEVSMDSCPSLESLLLLLALGKSDMKSEIHRAFLTALFSMQSSPVKEEENQRTGFVDAMRMLSSDFVQCYKCRTLLSWSLWWALATCGYFQVINYAQVLWEKVRPSQDYEIYNGYVETLSTLLGKGSSLS